MLLESLIAGSGLVFILGLLAFANHRNFRDKQKWKRRATMLKAQRDAERDWGFFWNG